MATNKLIKQEQRKFWGMNGVASSVPWVVLKGPVISPFNIGISAEEIINDERRKLIFLFFFKQQLTKHKMVPASPDSKKARGKAIKADKDDAEFRKSAAVNPPA